MGIASRRKKERRDKQDESYQEAEAIRNEDSRLQAITTLAEDFLSPWTGTKHLKGTPVKAIIPAPYKSQQMIQFGIPNMAALFLNYSHDLYQESQAGFDNYSFLKDPSKKDSADIFADEAILFDLLEKRIGSVIFAYTALETFANEHIPDDYIHEIERQDKRFIEKYNKEQLERSMPLSQKLQTVLPAILKVSSPAGKSTWDKFKDLEKLRNRLIHLKSSDLRSNKSPGEPNRDAIWNIIAVKEFDNPAIKAKDILGYYVSGMDQKPRWFMKLSL